jgi:hypothetical protein
MNQEFSPVNIIPTWFSMLIYHLRDNKKFWEKLVHILPYASHLFEVLEPNLMEISLKLTLTSFNSI